MKQTADKEDLQLLRRVSSIAANSFSSSPTTNSTTTSRNIDPLQLFGRRIPLTTKTIHNQRDQVERTIRILDTIEAALDAIEHSAYADTKKKRSSRNVAGRHPRTGRDN